MNTPLELRIEHLHTFAGPSIYADEPVIVAGLTVPERLLLDAHARIGRMNDACRAWFDAPVLPIKMTASDVGRYLVTWARCALTEVRGVVNVAEVVVEFERDLLVLGYHNPRVSLSALELAGAIFSGADGRTSQDLTAVLDDFWRVCRRHHPDYQSMILMKAARTAGIPFLPFGSSAPYHQYGWGAKARVFFESASTADSLIGSQLAANKAACKAAIRSIGAPTPMHVSIESAVELEKAISTIGYPCVIKPLRGSKGKAVTAGIESFERAQVAFDAAHRANAGPVMVEQYVAGDEHRLLVVAGKFVAAIRREPPLVLGDGQRTIRQLVAELNQTRSSNMVRSRYLRPIPIDGVVLECLRTQRLEPDSVPAPGQRVSLRTNSNLSTGGICIDVTQQIHPSLRTMAEQLVTSIGLPTAGLDYVTKDITRPAWDSGGAFIEVNCVPGIDAAIAAGWSSDLIGRLTLGEDIGRIPVSLIVCESPQAESLASTRAPFLAQVVHNEVRVHESVYRIGSAEPWAAVQAALCNRGVHELEIFCTPAEIVAHGLPVDRLDRTVLVNVRLREEWRMAVERCSRAVEIRGS